MAMLVYQRVDECGKPTICRSFPHWFSFCIFYVYPRVSSNIDPAFEAFEIDHDDHHGHELGIPFFNKLSGFEHCSLVA